MKCRNCKNKLSNLFLDLGFAPPSNSYLKKDDLNFSEKTLPLRIFVCNKCWLVQTEDFAEPRELFEFDYAYYSSVSKTWLKHAKEYADKVVKEFNLNSDSFVIEIASNDGYLLKNFLGNGIPCLGIEPAKETADVSKKIGVPVITKFFNSKIAKEISKKRKPDLIIGNNVYAHVPDINDFTKGLKILINENGVITLEFPHLMELLKNNQFDTIYHEHYSYLSLNVVTNIFNNNGLKVWDVEQLKTHGGSLRIYGAHKNSKYKIKSSVNKIVETEHKNGLKNLSTFLNFQNSIEKIKLDLLEFLIKQKKSKKIVVGYGAAAKGNTLLNFSGIKPDLIKVIFDASPSKQNKYMPGSHIPIQHPKFIKDLKPDFVLIFPWNIAEEITNQHDYVFKWGGVFLTLIPKLKFIKK